MPVTIDDIRAAAKRIAGAVELTPFVRSRTLSKLTGAEIFLKFENLQFTASFKERGALNKLLSLSEAERKRGVIAMSAGNHAQAVAYHAARLGIPAVIVMPKGSPNTKVRNTRVHGAEVVLEGDSLADAARHAFERAKQDNLVFVHPYEDPLVIAGQGTCGLEMLEAMPDLDALVVPVGGGGFIAGVALAALLEYPQRFAGKRVGLPISGGNIDSRLLASVLMRGLVRDARLVRLRVTMPDVSGSLAKVAALIAEAGGNIVEVQHQRIFGTSSVRSPEVEFLIETRDLEHTEALVQALKGSGVKVATWF